MMFYFTVLEVDYQLHVLWSNRIQLSLQPDIHLPVLSDVGGRVVQRETGRFFLHVCVRWNNNDCILELKVT